MTKAPTAADKPALDPDGNLGSADAPKGKPADDASQDKAGDELKMSGRPKLFPVKLNRNYVPASEFFEVTEAVAPPQVGAGSGGKIWAGSIVRLPVDEARGLIADKRAERADELPD